MYNLVMYISNIADGHGVKQTVENDGDEEQESNEHHSRRIRDERQTPKVEFTRHHYHHFHHSVGNVIEEIALIATRRWFANLIFVFRDKEEESERQDEGE